MGDDAASGAERPIGDGSKVGGVADSHTLSIDLGDLGGAVAADDLVAIIRAREGRLTRVHVENGRLLGRFDLHRCLAEPYGLSFSSVEFEWPLRLSDLTLYWLRMEDCVCPGLELARATLGEFRLVRCRIAGLLDLDSARLERGFGIHQSKLGVGGARSVRGCWLRSGASLGFERLEAHGMIDFLGATIDGELWVHRADVRRGTGDYSFRAQLASVAGSLRLLGRFDGEVRLGHVTVNGDLDLRRSRFQGADTALSVDSARIAGRARLSRGFTCHGQVLLVAAEVRDLDLREAVVESSTVAVLLDRLVTRNDVDLAGADIRGGVQAQTAHVGGAFVVDGATIRSSDPERVAALDLENTAITGNLLAKKANLRGGLRCPGLTVKHIFIEDTTVTRPANVAVSFLHARIATELRLGSLNLEGGISLSGATTADLRDRPASWSTASFVDLDGFQYGRLSDPGWTPAQRIDWLRHPQADDQGRPMFRPGPYDTLAAVYRAQGEPDQALSVLIAKEDDRPAHLRPGSARGWLAYLGRHSLRVLIAHGYRPGRAVWLLAGFVIGLALLLAIGPNHGGVMRSVDPTSPSGFVPAVFSTDTVLPVIDFGEASAWRVDPAAPWAWLYRTAIWASVGAGWILSTMLVAAIGRLVRSDGGVRP